MGQAIPETREIRVNSRVWINLPGCPARSQSIRLTLCGEYAFAILLKLVPPSITSLRLIGRDLAGSVAGAGRGEYHVDMTAPIRTPVAIIIGSAIIAGSTALALWATTPRYEIVGSGAGVVARLDRKTGTVDGCYGIRCQPLLPAPSTVKGAMPAPPPGYTIDAANSAAGE